MPRIPFALSCLLVFALSACAWNKPITPWSFSGDCNFGFSGGQDDICSTGRQHICKAFTDGLTAPFASRAACMQKCNDLRDSQYQEHVMDGCLPSLTAAYDLCGQFCERNYPKN